MLKSLSIQNYALIEKLDITFSDGLTIITGETGAGKSILLGAVSLLLGGKAEMTILRGGKNCVVEGVFEVDGREFILRRVISSGGRSRSFINDEPATNADLAQLSGTLVDIHAQHKHLLLGEKEYQMGVLDSFAGAGELLKEYKESFGKVADFKAQIAELERALASAEAEREFTEFQLSKLNEADIQPGELQELEKEQLTLANAEQIKSAAEGALQLLQEDEGSILLKMKEIEILLEKNAEVAPAFKTLAERIKSCRIECKDISDEIESFSSKIDISPERLQWVEGRMELIYSLLKRHNVSNTEELEKIRMELSQKLEVGVTGREYKEELSKELEKEEVTLAHLATQLTALRKEKAGLLAQTVQNQIQMLEMPRARFSVAVTPRAGGPVASGADDVNFLFSANGDRLVELQKVASGGELSRLMLCIKKIMASYTGMPTMIFDEIDVGVSGSIADKMGSLIGEMGEKMQIFAITHLPQIASKGASHLLVYKEFIDGKAVTKIKFIAGRERTLEIARLLSGELTTKEAIANAEVLLRNSN